MLSAAEEMLSEVSEIIALRRDQLGRRVLVGVDGRDGAGKTTIADGLAACLRVRGIETYRAGIDDWHNPSAVRYRRGRDSPEGYYFDAYDFDALRTELLDPRWHRPLPVVVLRLGERCGRCVLTYRGRERCRVGL